MLGITQMSDAQLEQAVWVLSERRQARAQARGVRLNRNDEGLRDIVSYFETPYGVLRLSMTDDDGVQAWLGDEQFGPEVNNREFDEYYIRLETQVYEILKVPHDTGLAVSLVCAFLDSRADEVQELFVQNVQEG